MIASIPGQLLAGILVRWVGVTAIVMGMTLILAPWLLSSVTGSLQLLPISGAFGAVLCGAGLVATWAGPTIIRPLSGLLLIVVGLVSLLSWSAPDVLTPLIPRLFGVDEILTGSLQPYWSSALLFISVGAIYLVPPRHAMARRLWQGTGLVWAGVGLALVIGHWLPDVSGHIAASPSGSTLIALFMTFLGAAVWGAGRYDASERLALSPVTWLVGLGGFLLSCLIWYSLNVQHQNDQLQNARTVASNMEAALNQLLRSHFVSLDRLAANWRNQGLLFGIDQPELNPAFITSSALFLADLRSFDALALSAPQRQPETELLASRGASTKWTEWLSRETVQACRQGNQWQCTLQFFPASDDHPARLMMAVPLANATDLVIGLVNVDTLMENNLHLNVAPFAITVRQGDLTVYERRPQGDTGARGMRMHTSNVSLFNVQEFTVTVWQSDPSDASRLPNLIMLASLVSLLLSIVIALTVEVSLTSAGRARALSRSVTSQRQLRAIEEMIARERPLHDIIDAIHQHLTSQLPDGLCLLFIREDGQGPEQLSACGGGGNDLEAMLRQAAGPEADSPLAHARQSGQPVKIPDIANDRRWPGFTRELVDEAYQSCFCFPVLSAPEQNMGLVVILRRQPGMMSLEDLGHVNEATLLIALAMDQEHSKSALVHASRFDHLTELPNRGYLQQQLQEWFNAGHRFSLLFIDLDGFKPINDSLGHAIGDQVLIQVAARIREVFPEPAFVSRLGGDEFVILVPEDAETNAGVRPGDLSGMIQNLLDSLAATYLVSGVQVSLTASIGATRVVPTAREQVDPMTFLQEADLGMYKAKRRGRNHFEWYQQGDQSQQHLKVQLRHDLQLALANQEFRLHYQPIIGQDGSVQGAEALLRWEHPERGMISPAVFIPLAEETGQIIPISAWVLQQACADTKALQSFGTTRVSINISPLQFQRANFQEQILTAIDEHSLTPDLLTIELTEHTLLEAEDTVPDALAALRQAGIGIAIDDFGTGFSSLSYLKWLPVTSLKIDRSFIVDMLDSERDTALLRAIIDMAHDLGLTAVAEGVERAEQSQRLNELGCDLQQGFYFARPKDFNALKMWLSSRNEWL